MFASRNLEIRVWEFFEELGFKGGIEACMIKLSFNLMKSEYKMF